MSKNALSIRSLGAYEFPVFSTLIFKGTIDRRKWRENARDLKAANDWEHCLMDEKEFSNALATLNVQGFADQNGEIFTPNTEALDAWKRDGRGL